jgi:hypothetical protein
MVSGGEGLGYAMLIEESIAAMMTAPAKKATPRFAASIFRRRPFAHPFLI